MSSKTLLKAQNLKQNSQKKQFKTNKKVPDSIDDSRISRFLSISDSSEAMNDLILFKNNLNKINKSNQIKEEDDDAEKEQYENRDNDNFKPNNQTTVPNLVKENFLNNIDSSHHQNYSNLPQNIKKEIIRNILRNLNVDEHVDKVLSKEIVEIKLHQGNPDVRPVRQRMIKLMKSDVIKINDKQYMDELVNRVQKSYEDELEQHMKVLIQKEEQRLKMLDILLLKQENERKSKNS